ncbi:MAG: hypothetical protein R2706_12380 [Acidimicrobiales bacterium]
MLAVERDGGRLRATLGSDHSDHRVVRTVGAVVVDNGTEVNAGPYFGLKEGSSNRGAVDYGANGGTAADNLHE